MIRSRSIRWIASIAAVVLLLPGCDGSDSAAADTTLVLATVAPTTTTAAAPTTTTTEAPTPTTEPATTTTATTLPPVLAEGSGNGDDVVAIDIPNAAVIATFTHNGVSNFSVWSLSGFENIDLLVNTIGGYEGTRPMQFDAEFDGEGVRGFEITADGDWSYVVAPLSEAEQVDCPLQGSGDDVVAVTNFVSSGGPANLAFDADTNFAISTWTRELDWHDLIVNEIGPYNGVVMVGSGHSVWDITANGGNWTIDCG